jgi:16S rRNA (cytosine1402-N4)-methyltransferase
VSGAPHIPVLLDAVIAALEPARGGVFLDGTFGAGGYTRALLEGGADRVIAIDRDPDAIARGAAMVAEHGRRLTLVEGRFGALDAIAAEAGAAALDGVTLDIGVSAMQLDEAERGFSFLRDGPLDMRMGQAGPSAADIVNTASETRLADILYHYGEERASRRIAKAILVARAEAPIETTLQLAAIVTRCLPRPKPGQSHPATRSFQALRIAVNGEYEALWQGLMAAERVLRPGGALAVVTFHSVEDRMVKRFFQEHGAKKARANRYAREEPAAPTEPFTLVTRKPIGPDATELAENPRARSAKLRVARRTAAPARTVAAHALAMPELPATR